MLLLFIYLSLALGISFFCSILEAVILSVTPSYIEVLEEESPKIGARLRSLKANIDRPLSAILSLNTIAHTVGAAGVGAQSFVVFGSSYVAVTSAILTFLILVLSEIIPKTLGAYYWHHLVGPAARILPVLIWCLYPFVILSQKLANLLAPREPKPHISREELQAMTSLASRDGLVTDHESRILRNLMSVGKLKVKDIMTPRTVMFTLPPDMTVGEVMEKYPDIKFSRIPVSGNDPEDIRSFVLRNDIVLETSLGNLDTRLRSISRDALMVPEIITVLSLFEQLLDRRIYIAFLVSEYGSIEGMVTMEDIVETLLGIEIIDETDVTVDMQAMARQQWEKRARSLGILHDDQNIDT
ncbi:MAG: CNNM domain-containing protein [Dehalococcoidia bacterium]